MTEIRLDTRELDRIAAGLDAKREEILLALAFEVQGEAAANAPYDTGALSNSIYVVGGGEDGYSAHAGAAGANNPKAKTVRIPEPPNDAGATVIRVGPSVEYGIYQELGTYKMWAQPYLLPALESISWKFNSGATWKELCE